MRIIKPSAQIELYMAPPLKLIERFGRTCYKSEEKIGEETDVRFVQMVLKRGHESVIEHISATVRFICDRGVSHEIVRHRLASYSQESTRYCNYSGDKFGGHITFIKPCFFEVCPLGEFNQDTILHLIKTKNCPDKLSVWLAAMNEAERFYFTLINDCNCQPQEARSVLPNSLKTELVMTANMREWRHFFKLRTSKAAHPQMREITIPLLQDFKKLFTVLFEDINHE